MKKKLFVVGGSNGYAGWILKLDYELTQNHEAADLFMFTGGEDIDPALYGETVGHNTHYNKIRDEYELKFYAYAYCNSIPMIGICRGGQFLTAQAGGKLVQDSIHPSKHNIVTSDGQRLEVTSSHHQQFLVAKDYTGFEEGVDYFLLGYAENLSHYHTDGRGIDYGFPVDYKEPEVVYYPETNALAIQSHPEWQEYNHPTVRYFQNLVKQLVNKTLCQNKESVLVS